jgi:ribosomal protein S21
MAINIEIEKNNNESNASMLRRFTKKVQGSGILPRVRSIRYSGRTLSPYKVKIQRLASIAKKTEIEELIRMGKMADRTETQSKLKLKSSK